ncbi:MAG: nucleotidyl transferase AbiEii/AbiGii toxin family protein [Pseudomonadota bacterium]|nr:nucleotidyl transferase AbiEii/AbiGii toxin family protein [Pseudomonadota bacterium]QKK05123.1 MAG: nucleotidyl transferase AbiEii/AbiGii toxin family protein [Pseudomonadota bacterium]
MPPLPYLHQHSGFQELIRIVAEEQGIDPVLVEKDYWIMHCLYGLQGAGFQFELKGGTSLSKGYGIIDRFSEDIDIRIAPPDGMEVKTGRNHDKPAHIESRKLFYDWLADHIKIDGIVSVSRDHEFDDEKYRSGGVRLHYESAFAVLPGLKEGILLELGFDAVAPNREVDISSWVYDFAAGKVEIIDNRAKRVKCYHPGYTLVEKLQTISTKFRKQQEAEEFSKNFLRHYYDVYCLLQQSDVQSFIGTEDYIAHKVKRFPAADNQVISENEAFLLSDPATRSLYETEYRKTASLYYKGQVTFETILQEISKWKGRL